MNPEAIVALEASATEAKTKADAAGGKDENLNQAAKEAAEALAKAKESSQDPLKVEADRVKKESEGKSELERAIFTYKKTGRTQSAIRQRIIELGGDPDAIDGAGPSNNGGSEEDNAPVTVGMLKKIEQEKAVKTAITLAQEQIKDPTELELVLHHLDVSVKPSGNASSDLAKARAIVNEIKNRQIAEEATRRPGRDAGRNEDRA